MNNSKTMNRPVSQRFIENLLARRYLRKDEQGRLIENETQMYRRVSKAIAAVEDRYGASRSEVAAIEERFFRLMAERLFLPNSPTLMNAGLPDGMLSACFVLGIEDSIEGIFETVKQTALVQKAGGGTGFSFDTLRPTGDTVASSGGTTSGPISFWRVIAEASRAIQQGARRRGANMGMMSITHPDIVNFIAAKRDPNRFTNFNISVKVSDAFMKVLAVSPDAPHVVTKPCTGQQYFLPKSLKAGGYGLADLAPASKEGAGCHTVRDVWNMLVSHAHATGEPGLCFIDRVNRDNPTPHLGRIEASNPCGEEPLLNDEACCLGSIDVSKFVLPDGGDVDWGRLKDTAHLATHFLDNVIDASSYPTPEIAAMTRGNRKIGLGVMGFADALILLGIRYDSDGAVRMAARLSKAIQAAAHETSRQLAEERGSFPNWQCSIWDTKYSRPMRNAACTVIAPTGSISILAGCSSGIEPIYNLVYRRRGLDGAEYLQFHPLVERIGHRDGWLSLRVRDQLAQDIPVAQIPEIPREFSEAIPTAHEIAPEWHVRVQAAFQEHVDNAVSKTVNLPANATVEDVDSVFRFAHEKDCKGITVYRDGSRDGQTLSAPCGAKTASTVVVPTPRPRNRVTEGKTFKYRMGCGTLFVTVNRDEQGLCEVFANLGKAGGCPSQSEATCRAVSAALRSGVPADELVGQLRGIRCMSTATARKNGNGIDVLSCPDAIARAIEETMGTGANPGVGSPRKLCPDCGAPLRKEEGCLVCSCGFSKCW